MQNSPSEITTIINLPREIANIICYDDSSIELVDLINKDKNDKYITQSINESIHNYNAPITTITAFELGEKRRNAKGLETIVLFGSSNGTIHGILICRSGAMKKKGLRTSRSESRFDLCTMPYFATKNNLSSIANPKIITCLSEHSFLVSNFNEIHVIKIKKLGDESRAKSFKEEVIRTSDTPLGLWPSMASQEIFFVGYSDGRCEIYSINEGNNGVRSLGCRKLDLYGDRISSIKGVVKNFNKDNYEVYFVILTNRVTTHTPLYKFHPLTPSALQSLD